MEVDNIQEDITVISRSLENTQLRAYSSRAITGMPHTASKDNFTSCEGDSDLYELISCRRRIACRRRQKTHETEYSTVHGARLCRENVLFSAAN